MQSLSAPAVVCPSCRGSLTVAPTELTCPRCEAAYRREGDLYGLIAPKAAAGAEASFYNEDDKARFGRDAEEVDPSSDRWVRDFLASLPPDARVLELGAGAGAFAGAHPGLVACDISWTTLAVHCTGPRVQADAQALPFADAAFDAVFSVFTIEHVPDPEAALAEVDRVLAPRGRALLYPAWLVRPWASDPVHYTDFANTRGRDRLRKATIPIRNSKPYQLLGILPGRVRRELALAAGRRRLRFDYRPLTPNLQTYLGHDSDAASSMDPHAMSAWFVSRGYQDLRRPKAGARLVYGYEPVEVRKPQ